MKKNDFVLVLLLLVILIIISFWESIIAILIAIFSLMLLLFYMYRKIEMKLKIINKNNANDYLQLESLFAIYNSLKIKKTFQHFRNWAISPDFANLLINVIINNKPNIILETGSGISTVISAYCLQENANGKIISLEHSDDYVNKTKKLISQHELQDFAEIIYSPLKDFKINNHNYLSYDFNRDLKIDLLIIDGPPADTQKNARFPVLPLFYDNLNDNAVIVLDDAIRDDEQEIVKMWLELYDNLYAEYIELEKGAYVIIKKPTVKKTGKL